MYTVSKNKNDYCYYLVKLRRCTKIETLIIRPSVLGVQNRFQLSRTFLPLYNFLAPPSVSRVNYARIRLLSMRGYLRSALYLYNSVVSWVIAQLSRGRALLCANGTPHTQLNRAAAFSATNEVLRRVLFSVQSVSQPVLSESLAILLDVVVSFQPEVSCRVHAIVSKLCRFFLAACLKLHPFPVYCTSRERERRKSSLSFHSTLEVL